MSMRREMLTGDSDHFGQEIAEGDIISNWMTREYGGTVRWSDVADDWVMTRGRDQETGVPLSELNLDEWMVEGSVYDTDDYWLKLF